MSTLQSLLRNCASSSSRLARIQRLSCSIRHNSSQATLPPGPTSEEWRCFNTVSANTKDRVSLRNPETAHIVAESFIDGKSICAGDDKIIIEAFPGPGILSRAFLELPKHKVRKLIILEDDEEFLKFLEPLAVADERVTVVPLSGYIWDTYAVLEQQGLLQDVAIHPWEGGVHPNLHFVSHLPHNIKGEQLIAQFFRMIPERLWLFKYGRVPMSLVLGEWIWDRTVATHGSVPRCKVSVIAEAVAQMQNSVRPSALKPYEDHFFPPPRKIGIGAAKKPESRKRGEPYQAGNVLPYEQQIIQKGELEKWDYLLRRLFVKKSTPLKKAIPYLAPGAQSLIKPLTDPSLPPEQQVDVTKLIRNLTIADWALIYRAFDEWPFSPDSLMISDYMNLSTVRK
ncbi:S-adenosyl-L-methionine-dependent methyltransferase [Abortiporus biennis]|nr:S-adenosyl-L-methionine-dependent methyltransferase [Abortiporus biennis]